MVTVYPNWTEEQLDQVKRLLTYGAMVEFALTMLARLPQPVVQVCGPLTTGGRGSFEENSKMLDMGIRQLCEQGITVFDQRPFDIPTNLITAGSTGYPIALLEEFYLPIFKSGYLSGLHFLPGWQSSFGASWEHKQALELYLSVSYFSEKEYLLSVYA